MALFPAPTAAMHRHKAAGSSWQPGHLELHIQLNRPAAVLQGEAARSAALSGQAAMWRLLHSSLCCRQ